jgi:hypothetical protein
LRYARPLARERSILGSHRERAVADANDSEFRLIPLADHLHVAEQIGVAARIDANATDVHDEPGGGKAMQVRMDGRHEVHGHRPVLGDTPEVRAVSATGDDLRSIETDALEVVDEALAHQVTLSRRHDGHARRVERLQHLEVVAHVIAVVVRQQDEHRLGLLARHVADEPFLGRVFLGLREVEATPPIVVPDPRVDVRDLLVVGRRELHDSAAEPARGNFSAGAGLRLRDRAERRECERATDSQQSLQQTTAIHPLSGNALRPRLCIHSLHFVTSRKVIRVSSRRLATGIVLRGATMLP